MSSDSTASTGASNGADDFCEPDSLLSLLRHRAPFLFVDRILEVTDKRIVARKCVAFNEPFFQGHFPDYPIMPGALILEGMGQAGCAMIGHRDGASRSIYLAAIESGRFKRPVLPGDVIIYEVESRNERAARGRFVCSAKVDGKVVSTATALWFGAESSRAKRGAAPAAKPKIAESLPKTAKGQSTSEAASSNPKEILDRLQHRYPFLLVDRIVEFLPQGIRALKQVSFNEPYFQGHFPGEPIMPGVLILEGMAQAGCVYIGHRDGGARTIHLASIDNGRFKQPVYPGETLLFESQLVSDRKRFGKMRCQASNSEGRVVATSEMTFAYAN
jgi:3-hydroxyacyl-[acyl-carrier-protein] dehydratase